MTLWDVLWQLDQQRSEEMAKALELSEPERSSIAKLSRENAELRDYKRRSELFLLSQGLTIPDA